VKEIEIEGKGGKVGRTNSAAICQKKRECTKEESISIILNAESRIESDGMVCKVLAKQTRARSADDSKGMVFTRKDTNKLRAYSSEHFAFAKQVNPLKTNKLY
jgi:hypothetical protein